MSHLFQALAERVDALRAARYDCPDFPAIGEILDFALEDPSTDQLRYPTQKREETLMAIVESSSTLADVPERKQDLVMGRYELPAPPVGATVAIKVIDMLGEEQTCRLTA